MQFQKQKLVISIILIWTVNCLNTKHQSFLQSLLKVKTTPPLLRFFRCSQLPTEQSETHALRIDTSIKVEGRFQLIRRIVENQKMNYERWIANNKDDGKTYFIKFYYKEDKSGLWQIKNKFSVPQTECDQLNAIKDTLQTAGIKSVRFEECADSDKTGGDSDSPVPFFNAFKAPLGKPLSHLCIQGNCRSKMKNIVKFIMEGLQALSMGPTAFFTIENITPDTIYYFENAVDKFVTFTDMKVNEFPIIDKTKRPWKIDMDQLGETISKLLTKQCDFEMTDEAKLSALELYLQVHENQDYLDNDQDIGVPPKIIHSTSSHECATFFDKQDMLRSSLYDFAVKCIMNDKQFIDPSEALNHQYLAESKKAQKIDRPTDV